MSLLMKALRQAEREHLASVAAAAEKTAAVPVTQDTLQLEPVETTGAAGEQQAKALLQGRAIGKCASSDQGDAPPPAVPGPQEPAPLSAQVSAPVSAPVPDQTDSAQTPTPAAAHEPDVAHEEYATPEAGAPESNAQELDATQLRAQQSTASLLASVTAAAAAITARAEPAGVRKETKPGTGARAAASASVAPEDPAPPGAETDERAAARYLVGAHPDRPRIRRVRALAGAVAGIVIAAIAFAYWQGLLGDVSSYLRLSPNTGYAGVATARLAPGNANPIGESAAPSNPVSKGAASVHPARRGASNAAAAPSIVANAKTIPGAAADDNEGARAPGAIHLRPPPFSPERILALLQEAYSAAARGDSNAARTAYEHVLEVDRNSGDAWIGLATLAVNAGDATSAGRYYRHALDIDPMDSVALAGLLGLQSGVEPQEYEARLRQLIARDANQPTLQAALGKLLARQGRWLEAQEAFFQAWALDPNQADVAFNLAVSLERIRQPEAAVSYYRHALQLTQNHKARFDEAVARARIVALAPAQK